MRYSSIDTSCVRKASGVQAFGWAALAGVTQCRLVAQCLRHRGHLAALA